MTTELDDAMQQGSVLGWNLAFSAGATAVSWALVSPRFAMGLALGAAREVVNSRSLYGSCRRIVARGAEGVAGAGPAVGAFGVRFLLLAAVLFFAIRAGIHPVGLVVGTSNHMEASQFGNRNRDPKAPEPPGSGCQVWLGESL